MCNLLTFARNIMCEEDGRATESLGLEGARLLALLQQLARAHAHHDKLRATALHQLRKLPACSLDGTARSHYL